MIFVSVVLDYFLVRNLTVIFRGIILKCFYHNNTTECSFVFYVSKKFKQKNFFYLRGKKFSLAPKFIFWLFINYKKMKI